MPDDPRDYESDNPEDYLPRGRRHPFDAHMETAPLWVKVVSRSGVAMSLAGGVVFFLGAYGLGQASKMSSAGGYLVGFGIVVSVVGMAFHPRPGR